LARSKILTSTVLTFAGKIFQSKRLFKDDFKVSKGLFAKRE
jgi:hypothetical protein